jgi:hypothetical protein
MALSSNLSIAVGSVTRSYNETGTLPQGKIRTAALTSGQAGLRISHEEKAKRDRGLLEFSETTTDATTGSPHTQKFHLVFDQPMQPNLKVADLQALIRGGLTWLLADDNLQRILIGEY